MTERIGDGILWGEGSQAPVDSSSQQRHRRRRLTGGQRRGPGTGEQATSGPGQERDGGDGTGWSVGGAAGVVEVRLEQLRGL